jgi:hypothetical protein
VDIDYPTLGVTLTVNGVYGLKAFARTGDSGAPIYEVRNDKAVVVGIVIGVATDEESGRSITCSMTFSMFNGGSRRRSEIPNSASYREFEGLSMKILNIAVVALTLTLLNAARG